MNKQPQYIVVGGGGKKKKAVAPTPKTSMEVDKEDSEWPSSLK